jgi:E3 ubiquitin-protein ligase HECTD1
MQRLQMFTPYELKLLVCGEQTPTWTREDIVNFTEPKFGYTKDSPMYQRFVNVMCDMTGDERKVSVW